MKLVKNRWLSWTLRAAIFLLLMAIILDIVSQPYRQRRFARITRGEVESGYRQLVAQGRLEMPAAGIDAVTFSSQHGGPPFAIWFHRGDQKREQFRYFAYRQPTPDGKRVWIFKDTKTKETIH